MADPMKIRANVVGDSTEVKVLMNHEMETGQRKDAQGKVIPAWFIQNVTATYNGKTVLSAQWGPAVTRDCLRWKRHANWTSDSTPTSWIASASSAICTGPMRNSTMPRWVRASTSPPR